MEYGINKSGMNKRCPSWIVVNLKCAANYKSMNGSTMILKNRSDLYTELYGQ